MSYPRVSIIILNWNGWKDTIECLESIYKITYPNYDIIVVDNGSRDDSVRRIKEYAEGKVEVNSKFFKYNPVNKPIKVFEISEDEARQGQFNRPFYEKYDVNRRMILIKNKDNYGFAGGNNIGMRFALSVLNPDYILLLNNDTVVDPNFLTELVKVAESDDKIGIVGPKIYYYDYNGRSDVISFTGADIILWKGIEKRYGYGEIDNGQWDKHMSVDKVEGSCMVIKRTVFQKVGFLDENFFAYWEETDLCFRAKKREFETIYIPKARIWHKESASFKKYVISSLRVYLMTRNMIWFIMKNATKSEKIAFLLYFVIIGFWRNLGNLLVVNRSIDASLAFIKGTYHGIVELMDD
ncbi:glycosyltransferase family 2 protein [Thermococcus sp. M39]|uniref:glycosyltransferase family 2 protein n=1 Tax=Thermococcus sp. M39 TaxID=1638262 RepID=UPI00143BFAFB|nr:glycosyltransferase family 2 protein [Thermococcus sp. M39]NJE06963.1 glycosyltransferase family 2 protein [Thermococcus sp. M39]